MVNHHKKKITGVILLLLFPGVLTTFAFGPPHDASNGMSCRNCHVSQLTLGNSGYNNVCLDCHKPGVPRGGVKPFVSADFANPFGTYTGARTGTVFQTSHAWNGPDTNLAAGAQPPQFSSMTAVGRKTGGALACVRCHNQHDNSIKPLLRMANDRDQMCLDCHRSRDRRQHTSGTHPVNFTYTSATSKVRTRPAEYNNPPLPANPANPTANVAFKNGVLLCTTCHSVHYADSDSSTFDNNSGYNFLKPSKGYLLRADFRGPNASAMNTCTLCHAGKLSHNARNQNIQCGDCHAGHVDTGDGSKPNVWLVRRFMNVSTSYGYKVRNKKVFFQSTSARNYKDASGTGVCQGCHEVPVGAGYPTEHTQADPGLCNVCHNHGNTQGAFSVVGGACNLCHGYPPRANVAGGPNGYAPGSPFTNESSGPHATHAGNSPYSKMCVECHKGNSHRTGTYQDVFIDTTGTIAATGGATPTFNGTTLSCSSVYCHSNGAPRGGTLVTRGTPSWLNGRRQIVGTPGECAACHGDAATLATNSHGKHLAGTIGCAVCHDATVSGNTVIKNFDIHVNGVKNVQFGGPLAAAGIWAGDTATCSGLYCHSNVQGVGGVSTPTLFAAPTWGSGSLNCGSCHQDMAADANPTGSHKKHAQIAAIPCATCHNGLGTGSPLHANGNVDTAFSGTANIGGTAATYSRPAHAAGAGYGRCSTTYCHSSVQNITDGTFSPITYASPQWGATDVICGSCHLNMAVDATGSGSHKLHANVSGNGQYPCVICHNGGGSGTANHANGIVNLSFTTPTVLTPPAVQGTIYSLGNTVVTGTNYTNATCANTTCHGSGTPRWGANTTTPTCDKCHTFAAPLPFKTTAGLSATTDAKAGVHTIHLSASTTVNPLTSIAKLAMSSNLSCTDCHTSITSVNQAGHLDAVGGAEIAFGALATTGGLVPVYNPATRSCANTYCHGNSLDKPASAVLSPSWNVTFLTGVIANDCGKCHGYPPANATHAGKTPTTCIICHPHVNGTGTGFSDPSKHINGVIDAPSSHPVPFYTHTSPPYTSCTICHNSSAVGPYPGVAGSAPNCRGCHLAADPTVIATGCTSCHAAPPDGISYPNIAGNHTKHNVLVGTPNNCAICHSGGGTGTGALHGPGNRGTNPAVVNVVFTASQAGAAAVWNASTRSCSSTYCHSNGGTNGSAPVYAVPSWGSVLTCGSCHTDMALSPAATGSHVQHAQTTGGNYGCAICHNGGGSGAAHADKLVEIGFTGNGTGTVYSKGTAPTSGTAFGGCSVSKCHGSGVPVWGTSLWSGSVQCEKCHGSAGTVPFYSTAYPARVRAVTDSRVGAHTNHLNAATPGHGYSSNISCRECHTVPGTVNAAGHMSGQPAGIVFGTLAAAGGLVPTYSAATGSCANTYCHGNTLDKPVSARLSPVWNVPFLTGAAAIDCGTCHGYPPATTTHAGQTPLTCINCHSHVNATGTGFTNPSLHINGVVDAAGSCNSCHGYPPASPAFLATKPFGDYTAAGIENYTGGGGAHTIYSHVRRLANPAEAFANCDKCHNPADHKMSPVQFLPSTNIKVRVNSNFAYEPVKLARYSSNRLNGVTHVTGICSNINCHFGATPKWDPLH